MGLGVRVGVGVRVRIRVRVVPADLRGHLQESLARLGPHGDTACMRLELPPLDHLPKVARPHGDLVVAVGL